MPEVPVETETDGVRARPRRTGHALADLILGLSAILISLVSLWVAVEHGRTERELVAASTWPFPQVDTYRTDEPKGGQVSKLVMENAGVGPARLVSFILRYDGRPMRSPGALLAACCGVPPGTTADTRGRYGMVSEGGVLGVLEAHEHQDFLAMSSTHEAVRAAFQSAWPHLSYEACYCSVLDQCWRSDLSSTGTPQRVASCRASADDYHDDYQD